MHTNHMKKIVVVGAGTAGLLSLSYFCSFLDNTWEVVSIHDPNIDILGVGESTTPRVPFNLFHGMGFSFSQDSELIDSTIKHYVRYVNWRKNDIISLIDTGTYGIHFNNLKLKDFAIKKLSEKWGTKFKEIKSKVISIENNKDNVLIQLEDQKYSCDYLIDCRGYPEDYSEYTISKNLPLNHCIVHTIQKPGDWDYTYHYAHKNGWMFGIPLTTRQGWGYLYNDRITSKEDAIEDMSKILEINSQDLKVKDFEFKPYYANNILNGRVLKNGNRFLFFEPIEALSSFYYDEANRFFGEYILGKITESEINSTFRNYANMLENFICFVYHGGSIYDSDFWKYAKKITSDKIKNDITFKNFVGYMNSFKKNPNLAGGVKPFSPWSWFNFDKSFGYNYFDRGYV